MPKFVVNWRLELDGVAYEQGAEIELKDGSALVANGTLSEVVEAKKPAAKKQEAKEG